MLYCFCCEYIIIIIVTDWNYRQTSTSHENKNWIKRKQSNTQIEYRYIINHHSAINKFFFNHNNMLCFFVSLLFFYLHYQHSLLVFFYLHCPPPLPGAGERRSLSKTPQCCRQTQSWPGSPQGQAEVGLICPNLKQPTFMNMQGFTCKVLRSIYIYCHSFISFCTDKSASYIHTVFNIFVWKNLS